VSRRYRRGVIFLEDFERFAGSLTCLYLPMAKSSSQNRWSDCRQPNSFAAFRKAFTKSSGLALPVFVIGTPYIANASKISSVSQLTQGMSFLEYL
jgi:hypothetical protein